MREIGVVLDGSAGSGYAGPGECAVLDSKAARLPRSGSPSNPLRLGAAPGRTLLRSTSRTAATAVGLHRRRRVGGATRFW